MKNELMKFLPHGYRKEVVRIMKEVHDIDVRPDYVTMIKRGFRNNAKIMEVILEVAEAHKNRENRIAEKLKKAS